MTRWKPSPWQRWQQPCGELKEKIRGSSSGIEVPHFRQAKRSLNSSTSPRLPALGPLSTLAPGASSPSVTAAPPPPPISSTSTRPSASCDAASTDSARRLRTPSFITRRSTTIEMSCLNFLSSSIGSSSRRSSPSITRARIALGAHLLEQPPVLALAPADHRRHDHEPRALGQGQHAVGDLLQRLAGDRRAAVVAVRLTDPRPQQAQVVVDLGHRPDRRARVARGRLLVDRDRRPQALDRVHVGLLHLAEELARVGRQRLDVAALALGVDRVERKARLARAREPRDHDQRVARQLEVDALEVVRPSAGDRRSGLKRP